MSSDGKIEGAVMMTADSARRIFQDKEQVVKENLRLVRENEELRKVLLGLRHPAATQVFA